MARPLGSLIPYPTHGIGASAIWGGPRNDKEVLIVDMMNDTVVRRNKDDLPEIFKELGKLAEGAVDGKISAVLVGMGGSGKTATLNEVLDQLKMGSVSVRIEEHPLASSSSNSSSSSSPLVEPEMTKREKKARQAENRHKRDRQQFSRHTKY